MSLGSHITKWGKAAVAANLASTPREPLLFLYPQWIRHSSTAASEPASIRDGSPANVSSRNYTTSSLSLRSFETETHINNPSQPNTVKTQSAVSSAQPVEESPGASTPVENTDHSMRREGINAHGSLRWENYKESRRKHTTPVIKSKIRKIIRSAEQAKKDADQDRAIRQTYQTSRREQMLSWVPDWRVVLADMNKSTSRNEKWVDNAINVSVPKSAVGQLVQGVDDNMWDIAKKHGCSVKLTSRDHIVEENLGFLISGSVTAIGKVVAEVLRIAPEVGFKAGSQVLLSHISKPTASLAITNPNRETGGGVRVRNVRSKNRWKTPTTSASKVPKPSEWTVQTFADYVDDLTSMEMPNHLHRMLYRRGNDHIVAVRNILMKVFTDPECKSSLSRAAFNTAMEYFVKRNRIVDARILFVHMDMMKLQMNPETFNIFLRGAAKSEDLHNFHFILHLMLRRGLAPNSDTWIAFVMAMPHLRVKLYILGAMKEKGLLQHVSAVKAVCEQIVSEEISASLDQGQSLEEFLEHMDSRYGRRWLTASSGTRILHALASRALISRCLEFLQTMDARFIKPSQVSIQAILNCCKQAGNVTGAIEIMKHLASSSQIVPNQDIYHALFEMAWRSRSYNLARVVWRYACLNAATTHRMRTLVFQSLFSTTKKAEVGLSRNRGWTRHSGFVIIGTNQLHGVLTSGLHKLHERYDNNMEDKVKIETMPRGHNGQTWLLNNTPPADMEEPVCTYDRLNAIVEAERHVNAQGKDCITWGRSQIPIVPPSHLLANRNQISKSEPPLAEGIKKFLEQEYEIFQSWAPLKPFTVMMEEAWQRDQDWKDPQRNEEMKDLSWKLEKAIAVPLRALGLPGRKRFTWIWR